MGKKKCLCCKKKLVGRQTKYCCKYCWNKDHKDIMKKCTLNFKKNNPRYYYNVGKDWRKAHPGYNAKATKKHWKNNPEKYKEFLRNKTKREMENKEVHLARSYGYLKKDKKCKLCNSQDKLEFHHTNYKENLGFTLCMPCHRNIHIQLKGGQKQNGI